MFQCSSMSLKGATLSAALSVFSLAASAQPQYKVTVTNITRGQILSPAIVATHSDSLAPLFTLGEPAGAELAAVAEDAVNGPLVSLLQGDSSVLEVKTITGVNGPILPGESASMVINAFGQFNNVSMAGMLVTTNDAFYALNGVEGPRGANKTVTYYSPGYDAGSEANTEMCAHIPGPPCGNALVRVTNGAEGYVHIHAGIHGGADLDPAQHDWRNPVAKITIERLTP
jgi:hypothetical protein